MPQVDGRPCASLGSCARSARLTYRNDHEAAVSRIDALERELADERARAREQADFDRKRIAMLERELADLHRHSGRDPPPRGVPTAVAPIDELDDRPLADRGPAISVPLLVAMLLTTFAVIALLIGYV